MSAILHRRPVTLFINGRFLTQPVTGVQRYGRQMLKWLDYHLVYPTAAKKLRVILLIPRNARVDIGLDAIVPARVGRLVGHWWDQMELPYYSRGGVLLSLCGTGPVLHKQHFLVIHDAAVFAHPVAYTRLYAQAHRILNRLLSRSVMGLATVSRFSRRELCRTLHLDPRNVDVLPNGADHLMLTPSDPSVLISLTLTPRSYVVALGGNSINKNVETAVHAISRVASHMPLKLVVVEPKKTAGVFQGSGRYDHPAVIRVSNLSDGQLRALYERAACLVFPSIYEGFGLPPLEAMSCGCPVVVSDIPAHRETCGCAALYSRATDDETIAQHILSLATSPALRAEMCSRGQERVRKFTWQASARLLMDRLRSKLDTDLG